jgi:antitoxin component YwqK of YwqJK toxin-antitoxin module
MEWYGYSLILPIPASRSSAYYTYKDQTGAWVREGPYVEYYRNGNLRLESYYVHGQLDGKESVFNEYGNEMFRIYWAQDKQLREIRCPCVDP